MDNKEEKVKKSKSKIIIAILLIIIIAGGSVFAGFFIASKKGQTATIVNKNLSSIEPKLYALGDFVVNLGGSDTGRYIKVNIYLGHVIKNKNIEKELESKKRILRDEINMYLLTKKSSDINYKGLKKIKEDLLKKINSLLIEGQVENIYFDSILVQ